MIRSSASLLAVGWMITGAGMSAQDAGDTDDHRPPLRDGMHPRRWVVGKGWVYFPDSMTEAEIADVIRIRPEDLAETDYDLDRFRLYAHCDPMAFYQNGVPPELLEIGLTEESLQAAVESRLRAARLYDPTSATRLNLYLNAVGRGTWMNLEFRKLVFDRNSRSAHWAATWIHGGGGTYGNDAGDILSLVSTLMDKFLVEYLRVNEEACERRFALPNPRNEE